jgi:hypothetical protein
VSRSTQIRFSVSDAERFYTAAPFEFATFQSPSASMRFSTIVIYGSLVLAGSAFASPYPNEYVYLQLLPIVISKSLTLLAHQVWSPEQGELVQP